jgi:hypothetical protein
MPQVLSTMVVVTTVVPETNDIARDHAPSLVEEKWKMVEDKLHKETDSLLEKIDVYRVHANKLDLLSQMNRNLSGELRNRELEMEKLQSSVLLSQVISLDAQLFDANEAYKKQQLEYLELYERREALIAVNTEKNAHLAQLKEAVGESIVNAQKNWKKAGAKISGIIKMKK